MSKFCINDSRLIESYGNRDLISLSQIKALIIDTDTQRAITNKQLIDEIGKSYNKKRISNALEENGNNLSRTLLNNTYFRRGFIEFVNNKILNFEFGNLSPEKEKLSDLLSQILTHDKEKYKGTLKHASSTPAINVYKQI